MRTKSPYEWRICRKHLNKIEVEFRIAFGTTGDELPGVSYYKQLYCLIKEYGEDISEKEMLQFLSENNGVVKNAGELTAGELEKYWKRREKIFGNPDKNVPEELEKISEAELKRRSDIKQYLVEALRSITKKEPEKKEISRTMEFTFKRNNENSLIITIAGEVKKKTELAEAEGREYNREIEFIKEVARRVA